MQDASFSVVSIVSGTGDARSTTPSLTWRLAGDTAVVEVVGLLDATTRKQFADYLAQTGSSVILGLTGVSFMNSRGLRLIVHRWQAATASGVGVGYPASR
ncbi:STAS domain-containing protein [Nonomuraea sp. B12E4]|uniref:STAS domain-containing protein n=1 Tax=Nonomuraea sp. B12E4 TaxID=3153564 RepID=UPI00325D6A08